MKRLLAIVVMFGFLVVPLMLQGQEIQSKWKNLNFISTDELKRAYDAKEDFALINALSPIEFAEIRIKGSINIPYGRLKYGKVKLPPDKNKKLIFYCKGPKCTKSKKSAKTAAKRGYKNVHVYNEGLPAWVKRGYPTESDVTYPKQHIPLISAVELKGMIDRNENIYIVDLRDKEDSQAGRIKGSANIPTEDLQDRYREIPRDRKIIILDLYGKQAYIAARYLTLKGYKNIYRLDGGFIGGWIRAGYSVQQ